jgi:hypothetical protein
MQPSGIWLIVSIAVLVIIGLAAWLYWRNKRRRDLRIRFGPEYDRAVTEMGDQSRAESELTKRKERVRHFRIVPLSPEDARRFGDRWRSIQSRFVDAPQMAAKEADTLIREVMQARGYPVDDFEQCVADLSVDHAAVVDKYRKAHEISERSHAGPVDTEELRTALVHYRALFDDLLEVRKPAA